VALSAAGLEDTSALGDVSCEGCKQWLSCWGAEYG
jgi:hypothetical protein